MSDEVKSEVDPLAAWLPHMPGDSVAMMALTLQMRSLAKGIQEYTGDPTAYPCVVAMERLKEVHMWVHS